MRISTEEGSFVELFVRFDRMSNHALVRQLLLEHLDR